MKRSLLFFLISFNFLSASAQNDPGLTTGDTGTVTFVYGGGVHTYTTVRAADGQIWLQQNLGAAQVATSMSDAASYGHLFQWGRWDDGHQLTNSPSTPATGLGTSNNPSGLGLGTPLFYTGNFPDDWWGNGTAQDAWTDNIPSANTGIDPCTKLGPDWHLPSEAEWGNLLTLEGITNTATAFSSNLKLPAAGMREPIFASLLNTNLYGSYWTSSPSGAYAKDVTILDNGINPSDDALRSYGFSVRCLATCTGVLPADSVQGPDTVCYGSTHTFSAPAVNNATGYTWAIPSGWTTVGSTTGTTLTVQSGSLSGMVSITAVNSCGPGDPAFHFVHVVPEPNPVINASGGTLSTGTFASYQWMFNGQAIGGATSSSYNATQGGNYQVAVTNSFGCADTSSVYSLSLGIDDAQNKATPGVYPNPASNRIYISNKTAMRITICGMDGRVVLQADQAKELDLSKLAMGTYLVRLSDKNGKVLNIEKLIVIRE